VSETAETTMIEFESRIGRAEHLRAVLVSESRSRPFVALILSGGLVVGLMEMREVVGRGNGGAMFVGVFYTLVWMGVLALLVLAVNAMKVFFGNNEALYEPVTVSVDPGGISTSSRLGNFRAAWEGFVMWRRADDLFLLYQTSRHFWPLNTADLSTDERERLADMLGQHVKRG
jgi:hypothetical protein